MIARPVRIVCTARGHRERELALVVPVTGRPGLKAMGFDWEPTADERRGWGVAESKTVIEPGSSRTIRKTPARIVLGRRGDVLHLPRCPSCGRAERIPDRMLAQVAAELPPGTSGQAGSWVVLDISELPKLL